MLPSVAHRLTGARSRPLLLRAAAIAIAVAVFAANAVVPSTTTPLTHPGTDAEIDAYLGHQVADMGMPGAAWAIVRDGRLAHVASAGVADAAGRPVTDSTPFVIGSLSKSLTALAIARLADTGRLDLDAPVTRFLPSFRLADPAAAARITVRQLLLQTSGLPATAAPLDAPPMTLEQRIGSFATVPPFAEPGTRYAYSNANYVLLGGIVAAATGLPYADAMRELVFAPLGMTHSTAERAQAVRLGLGDAHRFWFGRPSAVTPLDRPDLAPAGFIASTPGDLARVLAMIAGDGRIDGATFLSPSMVSQVTTGVAATGFGDSRYAFGWVTQTHAGRVTLMHDGSTTDMSAFQALVPGAGTGIVLLMDGQAIPYELLQKPDQVGLGALDLASGTEPAGTLELLYPLLDVLALAIVGVLALGLIRAIRVALRPTAPVRRGRLGQIGHVALRAYLDVAVPLLLVLRVPDALGASWPVIIRTDLGLVAAAIAGLRLSIGAVHLVAWRRSRREAAAATLAAPAAA